MTLMDKRPANMSMDKGQNRDVALGRIGRKQSHKVTDVLDGCVRIVRW